MFTQAGVSSWKRKKNLQLDLAMVNAKPVALSKSKVRPMSAAWMDITTKGPFYASALRKGKRPGMEDCAKTLYMPGPGRTLAAFGVFDGHRGATAAQFAAESLLSAIQTYDENGVTQAFLETDKRFCEFALKTHNLSGTTAVVAVLNGDRVITANVGDSRALLISDNSLTQLSYDHVAADPSEQQRVESSGGCIVQVGGVWRVQGSIAVTRGLGSPGYKQFIIPDPHVYLHRLCPLDQFLVLATDGLYMRMTNEEVRDVVLGNLALPLDQLAALLANTAIERGSPDNVTVTLVDLRTQLTRSKDLAIGDDSLMEDEPTQVPLLTPRHTSKFAF